MDFFTAAIAIGGILPAARIEKKKIGIDHSVLSKGGNGFGGKAKAQCMDIQEIHSRLDRAIALLVLFTGGCFFPPICWPAAKESKNSQEFPDRSGYLFQHGTIRLGIEWQTHYAMGCSKNHYEGFCKRQEK